MVVELLTSFDYMCYILVADSKLAKHCLDIYVPKGEREDQTLLPVVVHVHGGGWVRGDRTIGFYGSPHFCKHYASNGFLAFAPSYRLGHSPDHISDCIQALEWVYANCSSYGGDPTKVFISGHSAGGNIVALLAISQSFIQNPAYPIGFIKGVIAVSGVYTVAHPGPFGAALRVKPKYHIFHNRYVKHTFGDNQEMLIEHSPSCLLSLRLGRPAYVFPECKLTRIKKRLAEWTTGAEADRHAELELRGITQ
jgi:acetyl esterase/lipase